MFNSSNITAQSETQRCFFFERGRCRRGQSCRFVHLQNIDSGGFDENVGVNCSSSSPVAQEATVESTVARKVETSRKTCRHFLQKGWCAFGDGCRYSHCSTVHDEVPLEATASAEYSDVTVEKADAADRKAPLPRANVRKTERKLCRFFKAGYCRLGKRCRFRHSENGSKTSEDSNQSASLESSELQSNENKSIGPTLSTVQEENVGIVNQCQTKVKLDLQGTQQDDLCSKRATEIQQFHLRYPKAEESVDDSGQTVLKFTFEPTDPDWPYDVRQISMEVKFPENYPAQMMIVHVTGNERIPDTVERSLTDVIQDWVCQKYNTAKTTQNWQLVFRPLLLWLDRNAEHLMTDALKEYKRELMAKASGIQFIPVAKLREIYPDAVRSESSAESERFEISDEVISKADEDICASHRITKSDDEKENCVSNEELDPNVPVKLCLSAANQKGTEVSLTGLQLTDGAATLVASQITLVVACSRCTNTNEVRLVPGQTYRASCARCHVDQLMEFSSTIVHQMSSVVGWLNLEGCSAFDLAMADCQFIIGCSNCSKEEKINSVAPGHPNSTWCRHCHQKLTVYVDCARFVQLTPSVQIDASKAIQLDVKKPVKSVRDPAIQEGQPLPENGTCKHFKKSFRWLRFPCCGKAYPCDRCHNEKETDHEMKLANRIICGFCAKEQPYSSDRPCLSCSSIMTNKSTAHWEGGKGCRDQIKMSRNDTKKYMNSLKTVSSSSERKTDPAKKTIKLRHV